jgi:hypothetical protein
MRPTLGDGEERAQVEGRGSAVRPSRVRPAPGLLSSPDMKMNQNRELHKTSPNSFVMTMTSPRFSMTLMFRSFPSFLSFYHAKSCKRRQARYAWPLCCTLSGFSERYRLQILLPRCCLSPSTRSSRLWNRFQGINSWNISVSGEAQLSTYP